MLLVMNKWRADIMPPVELIISNSPLMRAPPAWRRKRRKKRRKRRKPLMSSRSVTQQWQPQEVRCGTDGPWSRRKPWLAVQVGARRPEEEA